MPLVCPSMTKSKAMFITEEDDGYEEAVENPPRLSMLNGVVLTWTDKDGTEHRVVFDE